jgi:hypothetical protein
MRKRRKAPLTNRERNIQRISNPPKPTANDRWHLALMAIEEWWGRHVSRREIYRRLDMAGCLIGRRNTPKELP